MLTQENISIARRFKFQMLNVQNISSVLEFFMY